LGSSITGRGYSAYSSFGLGCGLVMPDMKVGCKPLCKALTNDQRIKVDKSDRRQREKEKEKEKERENKKIAVTTKSGLEPKVKPNEPRNQRSRSGDRSIRNLLH
jgi:hypothetical protein